MKPGSLAWFARHEFNLGMRDFLGMMTAGNRKRERGVLLFMLGAAIVLHLIAWAILSPTMAAGEENPHASLILISGMLLLPFSLMASQAMESVTRVFYSRSDLDLILASPASSRRVFAVRIGAIALSTTLMSLLIAAPAVNVLALIDHPGWLAAYPVMMALGMFATVLALCITVFMFKTIGAKRTRLIAQIVAATVGAVFVIGIQLAAIASMGTLSRIQFMQSELVRNHAPGIDSFVWVPAKAAMGDPASLAIVVLLGVAAFGLAASALSASFGETVLAAAGASHSSKSHKHGRKFRTHSVASALRFKEWKLLARDQWLISQTLMQVFYLIPPGYMLWQGFGSASSATVVVIPVLVMASGQLAGGLSWLAISGEDAPQLVATAPVGIGAVVRAKVEAVLAVIAMVTSPIILILAFINPWHALICLCGVGAASVSAVAIQLWFRSQARRSNFRRRQTSSKLATFAEAFSSIFWAGFAGLWAAGSVWSLALAAGALVVLGLARNFRPQSAREFAF